MRRGLRDRQTENVRRLNGAVVDFSSLDLFAGHLTRVVQVRLFQFYYERLARLRVSPGGFAVLIAIHSNPGIQHGALAHAIAAHGPNLTKLVDRLVRAGWVERRAIAGDRRTTGHFLSTGGQKKAEAAFRAGLAHDETATASLSAGERKTLLRLLAKLDRGLATRPR
jgi:DNA-binding MarR family transcriptional regulator